MSGKPQKFVSQPADNNQLKLDDARLAKLKGEVAKKMSANGHGLV